MVSVYNKIKYLIILIFLLYFSDSNIQVVNKSTKSVMNFNGHKSPILSVKLDPRSEFLVKNCVLFNFFF